METIRACGRQEPDARLGTYSLGEDYEIEPAFLGPSAQPRCSDPVKGAPFGTQEAHLCDDCAKPHGFIW